MTSTQRLFLRILERSGFGWISLVDEDYQKEVELLHDELIEEDSHWDTFWRAEGRFTAMKASHSLKEQMIAENPDFCASARKWYLISRIEELRSKNDRKDYAEIRRLGRELQNLEHGKKWKRISPEDIERARAYPIERLIEVKNGMARCLEHDDSRPSMNCKNNFVFCHACGYHGDAIDVYRKLNQRSFNEAVHALQAI